MFYLTENVLPQMKRNFLIEKYIYEW